MATEQPAIYIIHHPETEWNKRGIIQGHLDSPLTEKGRHAAALYGELLSKNGIMHIYSSDLGRCMETAEIVRRYLGDIQITPAHELREQNYGSLNGHSNDEIDSVFDRHDPHAKPPHGESLADMSERIIRFVRTICSSADEPCLLVTHDGPFRAISESPLASHVVLIDLPQ
ncbi:MAG TPA: histidine phosphatase family protein [Candidatus Paceibacterota bacterium]